MFTASPAHALCCSVSSVVKNKALHKSPPKENHGAKAKNTRANCQLLFANCCNSHLLCFYLIRMPPKPLYNAACTNLKTGCRTNGNADSSYDYVFAAY